METVYLRKEEFEKIKESCVCEPDFNFQFEMKPTKYVNLDYEAPSKLTSNLKK